MRKAYKNGALKNEPRRKLSFSYLFFLLLDLLFDLVEEEIYPLEKFKTLMLDMGGLAPPEIDIYFLLEEVLVSRYRENHVDDIIFVMPDFQKLFVDVIFRFIGDGVMNAFYL